MTSSTVLQIELDIYKRLSLARLPVMPQVLLHLNEHCQNDMVEMGELAELIAKDVALTSLILSVANNSSRKGQFVSLEQSLLALGIDTVKTLLMHESAFAVFDCSNSVDTEQLHNFWRHSLHAAVTAQMIALHIGYPNIEEAYLGGLLHDVGRLALVTAASAECAAASFTLNECGSSEEQHSLPISHARAGAWLIERWHLDSFLADSVLYHHEPISKISKAHLLIRIVFLANLMAERAAGDGNEDSLEAAGMLCEIKVPDLGLIQQRAAEQVSKAASQLGIELGASGLQASSGQASAPQTVIMERLSGQIRDLVLVSEAGKSFARHDGLPGLLEAITQSARLLFQLEDAIVLLIDETGLSLKGTSTGEHRRRLAQLSVPLNNGGAIAQAVIHRNFSLIRSDDDLLSLVEEQLLRILGTECLTCLPLLAAGRCIGVIIGASPRWKLDSFQRNQHLVLGFCAQAASAINKTLSVHVHSRHQVDIATQAYRQASRQLAHEVNNPLSLIKNYLNVLDRKLAKQEAVNMEMSILHEEIDRVSQIVNDFADINIGSRDMATEIAQVVNDVVRLFRETEYVPSSVQIICRMQEQAFEVNISADALKQILVNLFKNAVEALPNGGMIEVRNNGFVNRDGQLYVELWIKDNGPGIPPEVMSNLFSPVATTKGAGHRGLGLSIVYNLLKESKGLIACRSGNEGTTFELLIPAAISGATMPALAKQARYSI